MRILVADDNPTCREMLLAWLEEWDLEVVAVADGLEAWEVLKQDDAPQLVILDWVMPGMDGFELATKLRRERPQQVAYILLITAAEKKDDIMRVMVCGADDYLIKPFDPTDLMIHLRNGMRVLRLIEKVEKLERLTRQVAAVAE